MKKFILKMLLILAVVFSFASVANADKLNVKVGDKFAVISSLDKEAFMNFVVIDSIANNKFLIKGTGQHTKTGEDFSFIAPFLVKNNVCVIDTQIVTKKEGKVKKEHLGLAFSFHNGSLREIHHKNIILVKTSSGTTSVPKHTNSVDVDRFTEEKQFVKNFIEEGESYAITNKHNPKLLLFFKIDKSLTNDLFIIKGSGTDIFGEKTSFVAALEKKQGNWISINKFKIKTGNKIKEDNNSIMFKIKGSSNSIVGLDHSMILTKTSTPEDMR